MLGLAKDISEGRDTSQKLSLQLEQARESLQTMQTQLTSLQALQKLVIGEEGKAVNEWLEHNGLNKAPRLMDKIKTEPGWETTVETVLGDFLEALCVDELELPSSSLDKIQTGRLTMLDKVKLSATSSVEGTLLAKVKAPVDLRELLGNILVADNIKSAFKKRQTLLPGQTVVTKDGVWMGANWLRVSRIAAKKGNVLQRKRDIQVLEKSVAKQQAQVVEVVTALESCKRELYENESERDRMQASYADAQKHHAHAEAEMAGWESNKENALQQEEQLRDYLDDVNRQIKQSEQELEESHEVKQAAEEIVEAFKTDKEELLQQRDNAVFSLDGARSEEVERRESMHKLALNLESYKSSLNAAHASIARMQEQAEQLKQRADAMQSTIGKDNAPLEDLTTQLKQLVDQRVELEHSLTAARSVTQKTEEQIRSEQEKNVTTQRTLEEQRNELNELQLAWQEANVRGKTMQEQLDEYEVTPDQVLSELAEEATLTQWEENVQSLERKITRLGPINLAAISEFEEHNERKEYLDQQNEDLLSALETLEDAIRKIDKETKDRFKDIFEKLNSRLQDMYPRLFGGGKAFLEMTGDDLLTTGVSIMARPPGKRLSSIQLMSGGEKALTAVALVFSLFELNPAPFCLLDEVDAPLDDANVNRFCELLKEMSDRVQFIYITHNKSTMEYANRLLGITMHEPGVSRIVSVDVDEAAELAAAS